MTQILFCFLFFNCYLAAPRPTFGHCQGGSLFNPTLITAFTYFDPKVNGSLVTRLGHKARTSTYWGLNWKPSNSQCNTLTHQATLKLILLLQFAVMHRNLIHPQDEFFILLTIKNCHSPPPPSSLVLQQVISIYQQNNTNMTINNIEYI